MAATHLVVLFCATAGKNGEDLGVDEQQIVLFTYLLFDVTNNRVIAVNNTYVRPQPNELSECVLTDECITDTGIDEECVKNSNTLEHSLDEFDRFLSAKGLHPDHHGKSFCLCTDGPYHLRQCFHPEASTKNLTLPSYFYRYHDIRKEINSFYKTNNNLTNLADISSHLGLDEDESVEYGIRNCQNMVKIIQRLITDGHTFENPEKINDRLEPGICSKNEHVDDSTVVRARGLPWQSSDQDIAKFFRGLNIAKGGVALCLSQQGRRNGEALIRFENTEQRDLAIKRHKHHIGQRYIEVYKATGKDFVDVAGGCNTEAQIFLSRGGQAIIRMRGLPFTANTQNILEFFSREPNSVSVLDGEDGILFVHYPDGRATGDAFVLVGTDEEANRAIRKHREMMGTRYIELFKSTTAEVQQVLNRSMDPRVTEPTEMSTLPLIAQIPAQPPVPYVPQSLITSGTIKDCVRLRHLPIGAQVTDILAFLADFSQFIVYQGVHMVYNAQGEAAGEAFIQMDSEESSYLTAINKHRKPMIFVNKKRIIDVIQCSGQDMSLVLTNGYPAINMPPPAIQTPMVPRPILSPATGGSAIMPFSQSTAAYPSTYPATYPASFPASYPGAYPFTALPQPLTGAFPSSLATLPPRSAYYPQVLYWYPTPPVSPQTYYTPTTPTPALPAPQSQSMIVMRGLPFNISTQDVMKFFQSYPDVTPESVQIQRTTDGRNSGDALITFSSRGEAEKAVNECNRQSLGQRFIEVFHAEPTKA